ncbi:MAG: LuxR family transcriptional regulator, partial [Acidimicrobiales bacterium]|nr:LuxR family transcriptional regulator [Acidimicrobiales bacterium]
ERRCYAGLDAASLRPEVLRLLRQVVPVDAAFFATVDPATLLFTSALAEEPLAEATPQFLENEFGRADVNKFASLAAGDPVASLDRATSGERSASPRYLEVMAPLGLGDELRAALVAGGRCWGVMCLHRGDSPSGFSSREVDLVRQLAPHLAEALRRAVLAQAASDRPDAQGPGILVLDENLRVVSANPAAETWLAELDDPEWTGDAGLPVAISAAVAQLARLEQGVDAPAPPTRLRTGRGRWITVHASRLEGPAGRQTAVVLEPASPVQLTSLFLDAHGLTPAQTRVAALVLQGHSTRQIVNELHISAHTLQEHLRAVFDKFGIGSRRELVAALLTPPH